MPDKYRFRLPVDEFEIYPDGTEVPRRFSMIERQQPNGRWVVVGFAEVQLVKVSRDESGVEDISVGFFGLVNPEHQETTPLPVSPPRREPLVVS